MTALVQEIAAVGVIVVVLVALVMGRRVSIAFGRLHAELVPNGGASLRDAIDRIETRVAALEAAASVLAAQVSRPSDDEPGEHPAA